MYFSEWLGVCQPNLLFITIKQYDIVHELTCADSTSQQNCVDKRKNCYLLKL